VLAAGAAAPAAAAAHTTPANQGAASTRGSGAHDAVSTSHIEVPMIRQIAPESSVPSLQPSTSGTSIIRSFLLACLPMHCLSDQICVHASFQPPDQTMYIKHWITNTALVLGCLGGLLSSNQSDIAK